MEGFYRGAQAQARISGLLIVGSIKLASAVVRMCWWLVTRHPLVLVGTVLLLFAKSWSRSPADQALVYGVVLALFCWWGLHSRTHRPTRGRRWRRIPAHYLERPDVQAWITGRLREGHSRASVAEALRIWSAVHGPSHVAGRPRTPRRLVRRLREQVEAVG